jgi:hypothetical protein
MSGNFINIILILSLKSNQGHHLCDGVARVSDDYDFNEKYRWIVDFKALSLCRVDAYSGI